MTQVTLHILAEDIKTTSYLNGNDCAITKALHRAGHPELQHSGLFIIKDKEDSFDVVCNDDEHRTFTKKVQDMYNGRTEIKDFSATLNLNL